MASSKLYPSLEEFYKNNNVENGDEDIWYSVSDQKLYRTRKRAHKNKDIANSNNNNNLNDTSQKNNITEEEQEVTSQCIMPSAPPLEEISWDELEDLEFYPDYSLLRDQTLLPPYSNHDPLSNTSWIDDLRPDYDDDDDSTILNDSDFINLSDSNNLTVCEQQLHGPLIRSDRPSNVEPTKKTVNNNNNNNSNITDNDGNKNNSTPTTKAHRRSSQPGYAGEGRNDSNNKQRQLTPENEQLSNSNGEDYMAWVRWRKQVNRQLAAFIMLRKGDHVRLQTVDLSRKPLSKTSMQEVFQKAVNDRPNEAATSLNGKPYIMYGIPRVALAKSPAMR